LTKRYPFYRRPYTVAHGGHHHGSRWRKVSNYRIDGLEKPRDEGSFCLSFCLKKLPIIKASRSRRK